MNQMIRDLLAFTHAESDPLLSEAKVDANETVRHALKHLQILIEESGAEIITGNLPVIKIQPTHLLQLFQNLIGNALKYRAKDVPPRIRVEAALDGRIWTFSVADNGIGFDSAFKEQVFGVFKRLHSNEEYSGNGIGLAICERIVRLYGGRIRAESAPGQGSTFYFSLPVVEAMEAPTKVMQTSV
jgi:light-regulated signal transduction histidine kinase (bacteriophytochrome)